MLLDILICVHEEDIKSLFPFALKLLFAHCAFIHKVHIVTPKPETLNSFLERSSIHNNPYPIIVHSDEDVVGKEGIKLNGWLRQQYIKLLADQVCESDYLIVLGGDTLILDHLTLDDLFEENCPILYFHRYTYPSRHLYFERERVLNVSSILQVHPEHSFMPGDFISDLFVFHVKHLLELRQHLDHLYGGNGLLNTLTQYVHRNDKSNFFGEWTLYSVFMLDVLGQEIKLRLAPSNWLRQIHSARDMRRPERYEAKIIHFVHKIENPVAVIEDLIASHRLRGEFVDSVG